MTSSVSNELLGGVAAKQERVESLAAEQERAEFLAAEQERAEFKCLQLLKQLEEATAMRTEVQEVIGSGCGSEKNC